MKRFLRITLLVLMTFVIGGGKILAQDETILMSAKYTTDTSLANSKTDGVYFSISYTKGTNDAKYYSSGTAVRVYAGGSFTVSSETKKIKEIQLTYNSKGIPSSSTTTVDSGTLDFSANPQIWSSSATEGVSSVTFKNTATKSTTWYLQKIAVTYVVEEGDTKTTFAGIENDKLEVIQGATFTSPTASVTAGETTLTDATITYTSSNEKVATVATDGTLTIKNAGTTTIKASYAGDDAKNYNASSASYILTVKGEYSTIMGLRTALHSTIEGDNITATLNLTDAIVTYVTGYNAYLQDASGAILVYISTNPLKAYENKKITGTANVTACLYNGLPQITSWNASSVEEGTATIDIPTVTLKQLTDNYDAYESMRIKVVNATVTSAFSSQNGEISQDDGTTYAVRAGSKSLTMTKGNVVTIIGFPGIYSTSSSTTYQLNVWSQDDITESVREDPNLSFPAETYSVDVSETFTAPTLTAPEGVTVKYASSNTAVANVDATTGAVTIVGNGITTITVTSEKNSTYMAGEASYTLAVVDPSITKASFDFSVPATYGYIAPAVNGSTTIDEGKTLVSGVVTITNVKGGTNTTTRFFHSSNTIDLRIYKGAQISISAPKDYVITGISSDVDLNTNLTWDSGTVTNKVWTGKANSVTVTATDKVQFSYMTVTYKEAFDVTLDDTQDYEPESANGQSVKLNRSFKKGGLGTICLPFGLTADQITAAFGEGTTLYEYTSVTGSTMNFTPVTKTTAAKPYIVRAGEDKDCLVFESVDITDDEEEFWDYENENGGTYRMVGTFSPMKMETDGSDLFLTASGELKMPASEDNNENVIKGFRAYFRIVSTEGEEGEAAGEAKISFGNMETNIQNIQLFDAATKVYSLNGQLVGSSLKGLSKGVYVVNGKKYIVK